jgi:curli biogenesis system outer membrane secretion channel CsgG
VLDFEDAAVSNQQLSADNPMALFMAMSGRGGQPQQANIGITVASLLTTELVKSGTYKVIERSQLQNVLKEQNLSTQGVVDQKNAAKLGKVLGVSALITGTVTEFTVNTRSRGIMGIGTKTTTGKVALTVRMIDATTGEILFAGDGSGEESASGVAVGGYYNSDMSNYGNTLLGKATKKALENIITQVVEYASKISEGPVSGLVAYYDNNTRCCYLDMGKETGVEKDQTLYVTRVVREIKSPTTGEVIKRVTEQVAELKVTEVDKASSTATCIAGKCEDIREKDLISSVKN